jgi:hypothetical protein
MNAAPSEARNSAVPTTSSTVPKRPSVPRIGTCGDDELVLKSGPDGVTVGRAYHILCGPAGVAIGRIDGDGRSSSRRQNSYIRRLESSSLDVVTWPRAPPLTASPSRSRLLDNVLEPGSRDPGIPGSSGAGCSRRPSCFSCRALSDFPLYPATLVLGILLAASDIDAVAIVGICVHVHDVVVLGSAHDPIRRYRPKILLRLRRIHEAHVKPRRYQHPLRISYLESLDRRACCTEEHRYGEEQGFWQECEVLLQRALDRTCGSRPVRDRHAVRPSLDGAQGGWACAWRTLRRRNGLRRELLDVATRAVINWPSFSNVFEMWVLSLDGRRASRVSQSRTPLTEDSHLRTEPVRSA